MANRYFIFSAAFNGDGTTSSEAASNGAAGAWNQTSILTGTAPTYGTLSAGDTVYIRSKTGNGANANISFAMSGAQVIGSSNGTSASWVHWVLDSNSIWSGVDGTMTFTCGSAASATVRSYNYLTCMKQDSWIIQETTAASNKNTLTTNTESGIGPLLVDLSAANAAHGAQIVTSNLSIFRNTHFKSSWRYQQLFTNANYGTTTFINCDVELLDAAETDPIWSTEQGLYGSLIDIVGGVVRGAGATTGVSLFKVDSGNIRAVGLQYPITMSVSAQPPYTSRELSVIGADGGSGAVGRLFAGQISSRNDGFFPVLNATLPDSAASGWSWWAYPQNARQAYPLTIKISKLYTSAAAAKTVTLEFLLATGFTGISKLNCFMEVVYIDHTTGLPKNSSSQDYSAASLDTSSASWSATTYGAVAFDKKKLAITTPTSIKQDTLVCVVFMFAATSANANQILFIDPDVQLT